MTAAILSRSRLDRFAVGRTHQDPKLSHQRDIARYELLPTKAVSELGLIFLYNEFHIETLQSDTTILTAPFPGQPGSIQIRKRSRLYDQAVPFGSCEARQQTRINSY